jgi:CBS domain-containing protein
MGVELVGFGPSVDLHIEPGGSFDGLCDTIARLPPGAPEEEERLIAARISCRRGEEHGGDECLLCPRYRGWRAGPGLSEVTIRCAWTPDTPVGDRMTRALVTVPPALDARQAERVMRDHGIRHLLVTDGLELCGVLCRCDLHPPPLPGERVRDRMTSALYVVGSDATFAEATAAMERLEIGCLPVVQGGTAIGILTRGDLLRAGVPARLLGGRPCVICGSHHGVRPDPQSGLDQCLDCLDLVDVSCDPRGYGEGD